MIIGRKVVLKLRYVSQSLHCKESCFKAVVCIMKCLLEGKLFLNFGMYYQVFIAREVVVKLRYILSSVHCRDSCFKVAVCIIKCSFQEKLF